MSVLSIEMTSIEGVERYGNMLAVAGDKGPRAVALAINRTGSTATSWVVKALSGQTGLTQKRIRQSVYGLKASASDLTYQIRSFGKDVPLEDFGARETRRGVSAAPFGQRQVFPGTFMRGGKFPNRVDLSLGGHVFERQGGRRLPIAKVESGVVVPHEMMQGAAIEAFGRAVETVLPRRLDHELSRILG